jgi:hypothetical protein
MLPSPLLEEVLREFHRSDPPYLMQMFDRVRAPHHVINPLRGSRLAMRAALRRGTDRRALLREMREELRIDLDVWREELTRPFRPTRVWASERPDFEVPGGARQAAPVARAETPEQAGDAIEVPV